MARLPRPTLTGIRRRVHSRLAIDRGDHRRSVFLSGSARSGTTWVADIIDHRHDYRMMFEPFHSEYVPLMRGWRWEQYIRPGDRDPRFVEPATAILSGRVRRRWVDAFNTRWVSDKRVIKEVRAQLFLAWLHELFPEVPLVTLLRHPCAVAASRVRIGAAQETRLDVFLAQPQLVEDHLAPFVDDLAAARDPFARQVWTWCVENVVALRQLTPGDALVVFYEDLCREPEREIGRLLGALGDEVTAEEARAAAARPSARSHPESAILVGSDPVSAWRAHVSDAQAAQALAICARFGLDGIYGAGDLPLVHGDDALRVLQG